MLVKGEIGGRQLLPIFYLIKLTHQIMTIKELIDSLSIYDENREVTIYQGFTTDNGWYDILDVVEDSVRNEAVLIKYVVPKDK